MAEDELVLLKKIHFGNLTEEELQRIYEEMPGHYRVLAQLIQNPRFPQVLSLKIIPKLFPADLMRVIRNKQTHPFIRKRAEIDFVVKYQRFPLGEKISFMRVAPHSLLENFIEENDRRVLRVLFENPQCTEELLLKFITRSTPRHHFYEMLEQTIWYRRPLVAAAIARDREAPIRIILRVIPYLELRKLQDLFAAVETHALVRKNIDLYLNDKENYPHK